MEPLPTILIIGGVLVVIAIIYVIVQAVNCDSGQKNQTAPQQSESKYEVSEHSSLAKDQKKKESFVR
ncbi:hypothetical protein ACEQPO_13775 [Bacillus sp. SL00103]